MNAHPWRWASAVVVLALVACAHRSAPSSTEPAPAAAAVTTRNVDYQTATTQLKGFVAYPATAEKRPAVIVVHEWWGLNDYARSRAKQLADMGYVAMAIDMFGEGKSTTHPEDAKKFVGEVMANLPEATARFRAAEDLLRADPRVDATKLAAIGYCFGGGVVLNMARQGEPLALVASFHGMIGTQTPMQPGAFAGRVLVANGAADSFVPPEQVEAFKKEMEAAGVRYEFDNYEGALHGFTNPEATELGKAAGLPLAYDEKADKESWARLTELLKESFGS